MSDAPHTFASLGPKLALQGFEPIPVAGKAPAVKRWQEVVLHRDQIAYWAANGQGHLNVGLRTGEIAAVDFDIYDPVVAARVYEAFVARFGEAPCRIGRAPKRLLVYASAEPRTKINSASWLRPNPEEGEKENKVEVLGIGQQFVAYGIHPDTQKPYQWPNGSLADLELWELPTIDLDAVAAWVREELPALIPSDWTVKGSATDGAAWDDDPFDAIKSRHDDVDLEALRWMLDQLPQDYCDDRDSWRNVIFAAHHQFRGTEEELEALEIVDEWSSKSVKYITGVVPAIWENAHEQRGGGLITVGSIKTWLGEKWKTYLATRKVAASAAVVVEAGWRERIASADAVTLKGPLAAEIRAAKLEKIDRETLVKHVQRRLAALEGVSPSIAAVRELLAAPRPAMATADDVELGDALSLAPAWAQPWVWDAGADCYVHRRTKEERTITSFNAEFSRNGADLIVGDERFDPHTMMTRFWRVPVVSGRMYYPPADSRDPIITFEDVRYLNSFRADLVVKPDAKVTPAGEQLRKALERHLSMLTPDARESALLRYWLAHNYMRPGVKIRWAPTIKGCEGDGKTVFLDVLGVVLGAANAHTLNGDTVLNSTFTGWAEGAAVVMVEEIRFQGHNRFEVANRLKPYITNDRVDVHAKGRDPRTVLNATNYMFATNHVDMLPIDDGDRRYFVLHSPFERKERMEAALQKRFGLSRKEHFAEIKALATAHPGQLALWLAESERPAEFNENGDAPITGARGITIQAARENDTDELVRRVLEGGAAGVRDQEAAAALSAWRDGPDDVELRQEADRACALAGWPGLPRTDDGEGWEAFSAVRTQQGTAPLVAGVGPDVVAFERLVDVLGDGRKAPSVRQIREALHAAGFQPLPGPPSRGSRARQVRWNGALCSIWVRDELLGADEACIRAELGRTLSADFE